MLFTQWVIPYSDANWRSYNDAKFRELFSQGVETDQLVTLVFFADPNHFAF